MKFKKLVLWLVVSVLVLSPSAKLFAQDVPPNDVSPNDVSPNIYLPSISSDSSSVSASVIQAAAQDPASPLNRALAFVREHRAEWGLTETDVADMVVKDYYTTHHNGVTHLYLRQRLQGIEVFNGDIQVNVAADGSIINFHNHFVPDLAAAANRVQPEISPTDAVVDAAQHMGLVTTQALDVVASFDGASQEVLVSNGGISRRNIPVELVFDVNDSDSHDKRVRLAWNVSIDRTDHDSWRNLRVDAVTGEVLAENDWVSHASYRVFDLPLEHPEDGVGLPASHSLVSNREDATASPFGWHDIDGAAGAEFSDTRGNNVYAQEDGNRNDSGGFRPAEVTAGSLNFDYAFDPTLEPNGGTNLHAAIINLFYQNNLIHDILYHYGFDEASGNFQINNYGRGGLGNDAVRADAQDGSGTNNANFMTPPDGFEPRMQMFVWTPATPDRDSDMDNGVILHEYAHGLSSRLTGGPSNAGCLFVDEQMGEGWSDFLGLSLTAKATDTASQARGMANYLIDQPASGNGTRAHPYSTEMSVNPQTYKSIHRATVPHGVGAVWAMMLWEVYWGFVKDYGFDTNLHTGTGGNNIALQLVIDGMKLQPCNPGFVDGRNAILLADQVNNGGVNQCLIWEAFAKRGLGVDALQGNTDNALDGTESFESPLSCQPRVHVSSASPVYPGQAFTYTLKVSNTLASILSGVVLTAAVPADATYVVDSASGGGIMTGGIVHWNLGTLPPGDVRTRTFSVRANWYKPPVLALLRDDMESGADQWNATGLWHQEDGTGNCTNSHSPTTSWYYGKTDTCTYDTGISENSGNIEGASTFLIPKDEITTLKFWSWEQTDNGLFDHRQVHMLVSSGWKFLWEGPVSSTATWYEVSLDLSGYAEENGRLGFLFHTGNASDNNFKGWYVDDIRVTSTQSLLTTTRISSDQGKHDTDALLTRLKPSASPPTTVNDTARADEDSAVTIDVLANDTDPNSHPLTLAGVTQPTHGTVTNNGTDVTYTPDANYHGVDTFTYGADNGVSGAMTGTVTVTVDPADDGPGAVAMAGPASGVVGQEYTFTATTTIVVADERLGERLGEPGVTPATGLPLTYTWQATDHPASEQIDGVSNSKRFVWTMPGVKHISLTVANAVGQSTTQLSITIGVGAPATVDVVADPTTLLADGASASVIAATVKDALGNVVPNQQVDFSTTLGNVTASATTDASGVAQATLTAATTPALITILAKAGDASGTAQVTLTAGVPASMTMTVTPTLLPANGASTSTIIVTVQDAFGNLLDDQPIDFITNLGDITALATTDANGTAQATLTSTTTLGMATIIAQTGDISGTAQLYFGGGTIQGVVFHDLNHNGTKESSEPGVAAVKVTATLEPQASQASEFGAIIAQILPQSADTNAAGEYEFDGLPLGQYRIDMVLPQGFSYVTPGSFVIMLASSDGLTLPNATLPGVGIGRRMFIPTVQR